MESEGDTIIFLRMWKKLKLFVWRGVWKSKMNVFLVEEGYPPINLPHLNRSTKKAPSISARGID